MNGSDFSEDFGVFVVSATDSIVYGNKANSVRSRFHRVRIATQSIFRRWIQVDVQLHRLEGLTVNSHARQGVDTNRKKTKAPKVRQLVNTQTTAGPLDLEHAFRPFSTP